MPSLLCVCVWVAFSFVLVCDMNSFQKWSFFCLWVSSSYKMKHRDTRGSLNLFHLAFCQLCQLLYYYTTSLFGPRFIPESVPLQGKGVDSPRILTYTTTCSVAAMVFFPTRTFSSLISSCNRKRHGLLGIYSRSLSTKHTLDLHTYVCMYVCLRRYSV